MNKIILVFVILSVVVWLEATQKPCRRQCSSQIYSQIVCAQDKDGRNCIKLKECRLRELNCRLRNRKQSMLMQTYIERCRFINDAIGKNKCAPPLSVVMIGSESKIWMRDCKHLRCSDNGKRACYWCPHKGDICQLLTACQAKRANCQRRWGNRLIRVDDNECKHLKSVHIGRCKKFN